MKEARLLGHPIHQMLIVFPLGLLPTAVLFDIIYLATGNTKWATISYWLIPVGIIGGLVAAIFGLIDWLGIPSGTRAKRVGALHGIGNVVVVLLFALSWFMRAGNGQVPNARMVAIAIAGLILAMFTGWLGGELVNRLGIGVDPGANANAPSSLSHEAAQPTRPVHQRG
jgi:uncharacterized membrane protein